MTEYEDQQLNFDVVLTGQKGPGRSCVVTVSTLDDSATGIGTHLFTNLISGMTSQLPE